MTRRPLLPLHDETSAAELLDRLAAFFTGDEPLTLRAGLL